MRTPAELREMAQKETETAKQLEGQMAEAFMEGKSVSDLEEKLERAQRRARQLEMAAKSADEDLERQRRKDMGDARERNMAEAADASEALFKAVGDLDAQMLMAEQAYEAVQLANLDLQQKLRTVGMSDANRLHNTMRSGLRWSAYHFAPTLAEALDVPRVPANRRRSLQQTVDAALPDFGEEDA